MKKKKRFAGEKHVGEEGGGGCDTPQVKKRKTTPLYETHSRNPKEHLFIIDIFADKVSFKLK